MIRILHTADLHLDSPLKSLANRNELLSEAVGIASRTALERMVECCLEENVEALLIAGDLFDGGLRSAHTAAYLVRQMERLREADVSVFYIKGNHDAENPVSGDVDLPANVTVFDDRGARVQLRDRDVWIHGVSFRSRKAPESLLPKYPEPVPGALNIALMHTSLSGAAGHDNYAPCTLDALRDAGFDYWALGHVHKRQVHARSPWIVMPGIPQGRDFGEAGPKSATLIEIEGGDIVGVREVPTSSVEFRECRCALDGAEDDDDIRRRIRESLRLEALEIASDAAILRLTLTGATARAWHVRRDPDFWHASASGFAEGFGKHWVEALRVEVEPQTRGHGPSGDPVDELARLMGDLREETGFRESIRKEFDDALGRLPAHRRNALAPGSEAADALLDRLSGDAVQRMVARLKGAVS